MILRTKVMGTNFYAVLPIKKKFSNKLREIADRMDNDPKYGYEVDNDLYEFKDELAKEPAYVHLGKRSGGWVFDWDGNDMKFYEPTLKSIKKFIEDNHAIIIDEYGQEYTWDEFINDELEDVLYDVLELLNGQRYYNKYPEHRTSYCRNYEKAIAMYRKYAKGKFIDPNYHDFITKEGLRFALYTDFS